MSIKHLMLADGRSTRLYRADERKKRGWFASIAWLRPFGNGVEVKLLGSAYLEDPPKRDRELAKLLLEVGIVP